MARIPVLAYRVLVHRKRVGGRDLPIEQHSYPDLPGAWAYREIALRRPNTRKVEVVFVLDESTPDHREGAAAPVIRANGAQHSEAGQ